MSDLELLLNGVPAFQKRILELRSAVFEEGPLDVRSRSLVTLAIALATGHPSFNEALIWAKQQGLQNAELGHIAAITAALRATDIGVSSKAEKQAAEQTESASCC